MRYKGSKCLSLLCRRKHKKNGLQTPSQYMQVTDLFSPLIFLALSRAPTILKCGGSYSSTHFGGRIRPQPSDTLHRKTERKEARETASAHPMSYRRKQALYHRLQGIIECNRVAVGEPVAPSQGMVSLYP